jgi:hypothetical protein
MVIFPQTVGMLRFSSLYRRRQFPAFNVWPSILAAVSLVFWPAFIPGECSCCQAKQAARLALVNSDAVGTSEEPTTKAVAGCCAAKSTSAPAEAGGCCRTKDSASAEAPLGSSCCESSTCQCGPNCCEVTLPDIVMERTHETEQSAAGLNSVPVIGFAWDAILSSEYLVQQYSSVAAQDRCAVLCRWLK